MISRRTANAISEIYVKMFRKSRRGIHGNVYYVLENDEVYDFLFSHDYEAWFCNTVKATYSSTNIRPFKEYIMQLHTGESLASASPDWTWKQREQLGQQYLFNLAVDALNYYSEISSEMTKNIYSEEIKSLINNLELDGFTYKNRTLLASETDVFDTNKETGILESTYTNLALRNKETAFHHLQLAEEHYLASRWDDSISNSRKFLEAVLQEVAYSHYVLLTELPLPDETYSYPARVREYLEKQGLLETKEKEALASVYGLLSNTGSHPYMAQNEQARLLRHLALTFAQFVMLRFQGFLVKNKNGKVSS